MWRHRLPITRTPSRHNKKLLLVAMVSIFMYFVSLISFAATEISSPSNLTEMEAFPVGSVSPSTVIAPICFGWQGVIVVYISSTLFRKNRQHRRIYNSPRLNNVAFYFQYGSTFVLAFCWWRQQRYVGEENWTLVIAIAWVVSALSALFIALARLRIKKTRVRSELRPFERTYMLVVVMNGLALYAAWANIKFLDTFSIVLQELNYGPFKEKNASLYVHIFMLSLEMPIIAFLELFLYGDQTVYVVSHRVLHTVRLIQILVSISVRPGERSIGLLSFAGMLEFIHEQANCYKVFMIVRKVQKASASRKKNMEEAKRDIDQILRQSMRIPNRPKVIRSVSLVSSTSST